MYLWRTLELLDVVHYLSCIAYSAIGQKVDLPREDRVFSRLQDSLDRLQDLCASEVCIKLLKVLYCILKVFLVIFNACREHQLVIRAERYNIKLWAQGKTVQEQFQSLHSELDGLPCHWAASIYDKDVLVKKRVYYLLLFLFGFFFCWIFWSNCLGNLRVTFRPVSVDTGSVKIQPEEKLLVYLNVIEVSQHIDRNSCGAFLVLWLSDKYRRFLDFRISDVQNEIPAIETSSSIMLCKLDPRNRLQEGVCLYFDLVVSWRQTSDVAGRLYVDSQVPLVGCPSRP